MERMDGIDIEVSYIDTKCFKLYPVWNVIKSNRSASFTALRLFLCIVKEDIRIGILM